MNFLFLNKKNPRSKINSEQGRIDRGTTLLTSRL